MATFSSQTNKAVEEGDKVLCQNLKHCNNWPLLLIANLIWLSFLSQGLLNLTGWTLTDDPPASVPHKYLNYRCAPLHSEQQQKASEFFLSISAEKNILKIFLLTSI